MLMYIPPLSPVLGSPRAFRTMPCTAKKWTILFGGGVDQEGEVLLLVCRDGLDYLSRPP